MQVRLSTLFTACSFVCPYSPHARGRLRSLALHVIHARQILGRRGVLDAFVISHPDEARKADRAPAFPEKGTGSRVYRREGEAVREASKSVGGRPHAGESSRVRTDSAPRISHTSEGLNQMSGRRASE